MVRLRCLCRLFEAACCQFGWHSRKKKKRNFVGEKNFFFSFVSHFIFCFLKEKSFVILLNLLTFQTQSSHSARYLRLVNSEGGLSAVHNLGSLLTWVGGEFLRN